MIVYTGSTITALEGRLLRSQAYPPNLASKCAHVGRGHPLLTTQKTRMVAAASVVEARVNASVASATALLRTGLACLDIRPNPEASHPEQAAPDSRPVPVLLLREQS